MHGVSRVHLHIVLQQGSLFVSLPFPHAPSLPRLHLQEGRSYFHPRCLLKTETPMLPSSFSSADEIGSSNDAENIADTSRLFILEFLNIQQCIVFAENTRRLCPLFISPSLSLSLSPLLFLYFRREHVYIRDRSQLRSLDILISQ